MARTKQVTFNVVEKNDELEYNYSYKEGSKPYSIHGRLYSGDSFVEVSKIIETGIVDTSWRGTENPSAVDTIISDIDEIIAENNW